MTTNSNPIKSPDSKNTDGTLPSKPASPKRDRRVAIKLVDIRVDENADDDVSNQMRRYLRCTNSALVSFAIHLVLIIVLTLFAFSGHQSRSVELAAEISIAPEKITDQLDQPNLMVEVSEQTEQNSVEQSLVVEDSVVPDTTEIDLSTNQSVDQSNDAATAEIVAPEIEEVNSQIVGGGLEGRKSGARSKLASQFGGTAGSELAVENGLKWLANHQFEDGSWRLNYSKGPCNGRCKNAGRLESTTAATGLALMAFLGAGYTHQTGPYQQQVLTGLDYLKSRIRKTYFGGNLTEGAKGMYGQGIATIALGEAYSMTRDPGLKEATESAMKYILTAQHSRGGWRYIPGQPGDMTVTGWQLMALKSCQISGLKVPPETFKRARDFLMTLGDDSSGKFGYQSTNPEPTTTAIGLLMQVYLGWGRDHRGMYEGSEYLKELGPSETNIYFNYYATQLLFHIRDDDWSSWNDQIREFLIATQSTSGHEAGSWFFQDEHGSVGGRLYTTAMAIMILEVYYRYLPLFDPESVKFISKRR